MKPLALEPNVLLRAYCWGRLAVVGFLVAVSPWAPAVFVPTASATLLVALVTLVVVSSGILLFLAGRRGPAWSSGCSACSTRP